jgi:CheY-like chemotaxis protein
MKSGENNNNNDFKNRNPFDQSQGKAKRADPDNRPEANGAHIFKVLPGGRNSDAASVVNTRSRHEEITARGLQMLNGGKNPDDKNVYTRNPHGAVTVARDPDPIPADPYESGPQDGGANNRTVFDSEADRYPPGINAQTPGRMTYRYVNPLSVVVVDENPAVLLTIMSTLQPCGYAVRAYKCAYDALMALKNEPCNVLIATEKMKQMSGGTFAEFAKTAGDATHILLLTDRWDNSVVNYMRRERIDGYLIKPISKNELLDKLNAIMDVT